MLTDFKAMFDESNSRQGMRQYLTYYFMAAHPGCTDDHMRELSGFCRDVLRTNPEQVQIFTPTPSTASTMMYHTGKDMKGRDVRSEKSMQRKQRQKEAVVRKGAGPARSRR